MTELKDLKRKHKKLEALIKKATKQRLNDRTSDTWINLRLKDKINQLKH